MMKGRASLLLSLVLLALSPLAFSSPVNINTADAAALEQAIKGVGPRRAEAIVEYRKNHGPFKSVDELTQVKGVGVKTIEENRQNLTVGKE